jgi:hypothetical protein
MSFRMPSRSTGISPVKTPVTSLNDRGSDSRCSWRASLSVRFLRNSSRRVAVYDLGFSFFSFHRADRPTPETLTTLNRTPGISPLALPLRPKPARRTSSFSSTKFKQPSLGTGVSLVCVQTFACRRRHPPASSCQAWIRREAVHVPKAVTFFPFLINWTLTHFRMAELGCLASTPTFSRTMPLAWEEPPNGDDLYAVPSRRFL